MGVLPLASCFKQRFLSVLNASVATERQMVCKMPAAFRIEDSVRRCCAEGPPLLPCVALLSNS